MRDVRDVEETDAAHPVLAHGILHALRAAIEASAEVLAGDEEKVAVDRDVVLGVGTHIEREQRGVARLRDVPHLEAVEVALNGDRKSTRLNSSHGYISYAVFCLKKKNDDIGD